MDVIERLQPDNITAQQVQPIVNSLVNEYHKLLNQARNDLPNYYQKDHKDSILRTATPIGYLNSYITTRLVPLSQYIQRNPGAKDGLPNFQHAIYELKQQMQQDPYRTWITGMAAKVNIV